MDKNEFCKLKECISDCSKCRLSSNRINVVFGEGNENAKVMFVGEAPGKEENKQGLPFVGAAGQFLNKMLEGIGWKREDVYITNIVKDQPPNNRDPEPDEIKICTENWLIPQIKIMDPKIIVPLGRHSMYFFLPNVGTISQIHGRVFRRKDGRVYVPLYHPAVALYNNSQKPILEKDFQLLPKVLKKLEES